VAFRSSTTYADLVESHAISEREGYTFLRRPNDFYFAIENLKRHATDRASAVSTYLKGYIRVSQTICNG
jgi:spore coat protein H